MSRKERIDPKCNRVGCLFRECGYCIILNDTNFGDDECTFYKPKDTKHDFVAGQIKKINDMWRKKDEQQ